MSKTDPIYTLDEREKWKKDRKKSKMRRKMASKSVRINRKK